MEAFLIILAAGSMCIASFVVGAKVGQCVADNKPIPLNSPAKAVQAHRNKKEAEREQSRIDTIMRNIESYDGTGNNQEDVPRG